MYRIEFREYPIMWVACHTFWTLYEDDWLIGELHGLATDRETGQSQPVGTSRDVLHAWPYPMMGQEQKMKPANGGFSGLYALDQASKVVFEGCKAETMAIWGRGLAAATALNDADIVYHILGGLPSELRTGNSNSAFRTFGDVMGLPMPELEAMMRPGDRKNLLPRESYASLYERAVAVA
jgi:hypothetical protein